MPIIALQKRARELGRIRIGQKTASGAPTKLDRFRLTSPSRPLLDKVAQLYGGTVAEWTPRGGAQQWEVVTESTRIPIIVPPQPVSQWLETWTAGGCIHRCDGVTNALTDEPCDPDSEAHQNAKPTTRLNVVLRDIEGVGVFRLETHGWNAAAELPQAADFLAQAGGYVSGWLSLEERVSKSDGKTRRFMVPTIEVDVTPTQLLAGAGGIRPGAGAPVERPALEADTTPASATDESPDPWATPVGQDPAEAAAAEYAEYHQMLAEAKTPEDAMKVYRIANERGVFDGADRDHPLYRAIGDRGRELRKTPPAASSEPVDAEVVDDDPDPDQVWQQILARGGELGMGLSELQSDFAKLNAGEHPDAASGAELAAYLRVLNQRDVA